MLGLAVKDNGFDLEKWYKLIIEFIVTLAKNGIIHGDLSPYNILNYNGEPFIIDFSQALKLSSITVNFLIRDITNVNNWFLALKYKNIKEIQSILDEIGWKDEN